MILRENINSSQSFSAFCHSIETETSHISDLHEKEIKIECKDSFKGYKISNKSLEKEPSLYYLNCHTVFVNTAYFFNNKEYSDNDRKVIILHECGHHYLTIIDPTYRNNKKFLVRKLSIV